MIISVVVIDSDKAFGQMLSAAVNDRNSNFTGLGWVNNNTDALDLIRTYLPDVILIDPHLEGEDGFRLIESIREIYNYSPIIYIISRFESSLFLEMVKYYGIDFYSMKPTTVQNVMNNLSTIHMIKSTDKAKARNLNAIIVNTLSELGIPVKLKSTRRTAMAIELCYFNESYFYDLGALYTQVGIKCDTTAGSVEKNIRDSVKRMLSANREPAHQLFKNARISNGLFLYMVTKKGLIASSPEDASVSDQVEQVLMNLGVPATAVGYSYLKTIIIWVLRDDFNEPVNLYYTRMESIYEKKAAVLDKNIRDALLKAEEASTKLYNTLFDTGRVSPSKFIVDAARYIYSLEP